MVKFTLCGVGLIAVAFANADIVLTNLPLSGATLSSDVLFGNRYKAVGFKMPAAGSSYTVNTIEAVISMNSTDIANGVMPVMRIYTSVTGEPNIRKPGSEYILFSSPTTYTTGYQKYTFTATNSLPLLPGTEYFAVMRGSQGANTIEWAFENPRPPYTGIATYTNQFTFNAIAWNQQSGLIGGNSMQINAEAVPEPATLSLLALGAVAALRRRKK